MNDDKYVDDKEKHFEEEISLLFKIEIEELGLMNFAIHSKFVNECFRPSRIEIGKFNLTNFSLDVKFCGEILRL